MLRRLQEAKEIPNLFAALLEQLYVSIWDPVITKYIRPSLSASTCRHLDRYCDNTRASGPTDESWSTHIRERQVGLPIVSYRKSMAPSMKCSVMVNADGFIVLGFQIKAARIKAVSPRGWRYSETSNYEFRSKVRLLRTKNLDISTLVEAGESAAKAIADAYIPDHLRRAA